MLSSRVISDSNMFIAMLRVEIVDDVCWSRLFAFASCANTKSPPLRGHWKLPWAAAGAANASIDAPASSVPTSPVRNMAMIDLPFFASDARAAPRVEPPVLDAIAAGREEQARGVPPRPRRLARAETPG